MAMTKIEWWSGFGLTKSRAEIWSIFSQLFVEKWPWYIAIYREHTVIGCVWLVTPVGFMHSSCMKILSVMVMSVIIRWHGHNNKSWSPIYHSKQKQVGGKLQYHDDITTWTELWWIFAVSLDKLFINHTDRALMVFLFSTWTIFLLNSWEGGKIIHTWCYPDDISMAQRKCMNSAETTGWHKAVIHKLEIVKLKLFISSKYITYMSIYFGARSRYLRQV